MLPIQLSKHVLFRDWSLKLVVLFWLLLRGLSSDLLHHQLHPEWNVLVRIVGLLQLSNLVARLCKQFAVDNFLGVMIFCFEKQIFASFFLRWFVRSIFLLIPREELIRWLNMLC